MGMIKRMIAQMYVTRKDHRTIKPRRTILGFEDDELVGGKPNKMFPLIIVATMENHDVCKILVDEGSSCEIICEDFFTKLGLKKECLALYMSIDLRMEEDKSE